MRLRLYRWIKGRAGRRSDKQAAMSYIEALLNPRLQSVRQCSVGKGGDRAPTAGSKHQEMGTATVVRT